MNDLKNLDRPLPLLNQDKLIGVLLYRNDAFLHKGNCKILIYWLQWDKPSTT